MVIGACPWFPGCFHRRGMSLLPGLRQPRIRPQMEAAVQGCQRWFTPFDYRRWPRALTGAGAAAAVAGTPLGVPTAAGAACAFEWCCVCYNRDKASRPAWPARF